MAADDDDGVVDLGERPPQVNGNRVAGVDPLRKAGNQREAVGAHQRHNDAGAALERGGDEPPADTPQLHPQPLVLAHRREHLAAHHGLDRLRRRALPPQHPVEQRFQEKLRRHHCGGGVAGDAQHGRLSDDTQDDGVPGPHRDAVDQQLAEVADDGRGEVLRSRGGAGVDRHGVALAGRRRDGLGDQRGVVGDDGLAERLAAPFRHLPRQHQRVVLDDVALARRGGGRDELAARRNDRDAWPPPYRYRGHAAGRRRAHVFGADGVVLGQHELRGHDVLAHGPDVLPGGGGGHDLDIAARLVDHLAHDHRVEAVGHGVAGIDPDRLRADPAAGWGRSRWRGRCPRRAPRPRPWRRRCSAARSGAPRWARRSRGPGLRRGARPPPRAGRGRPRRDARRSGGTPPRWARLRGSTPGAVRDGDGRAPCRHSSARRAAWGGTRYNPPRPSLPPPPSGAAVRVRKRGAA